MNMGLMNFDDTMPPVADPIQPGVQVPQAQAAQLPPTPQRPSLMARIGHALMAAGGHVSDAIRPDAPGGYEGLLTPDEMQKARPSLLHSLIGGPGAPSSDAQYAGNLDSLVQHKALSAEMQRQKEVLDARRGLMTRFPLPTSGNEADLGKWANQVLPWLMQSGDFEGVKTLQPLVGAFAKQTEKQFVPQLFKGPTGELRYFSPNEQTQIPDGWTPFLKPGSAGAGTPQLFRGPNGDYVGVAPGDNDKLAELSKKGYKPEVTARTEFVQGNVQDRFDTGRDDKAIQQFQQRLTTAGITKAAPVLNQSIQTIADARNNPDPNVRKVLYTSAIANFVQAADPKAQIRWQLLNYFKDNINASAADRVKLLISRLKDGTLPDSVLEGMANHLTTLKGMMKNEIAGQRKAFLKERPDLELDDRLSDESQFFPNDAAGGNTPTTPTTQDTDTAARAAWAKTNPPQKGETREQYKARFEKTRRGK